MSFHVHLYDIPCENLNLKVIRDYLSERLPKLKIDIRGNFLRYHTKDKDLFETASKLASIRVLDLNSSFKKNKLLYGEIEYEKAALAGKSSAGVLYDGFELYSLYRSILPKSESNLKHIHIAFTDRLIGTFDEDDLRYHARAIICSMPSIISTSGIVEAPAKPREYYLKKNAHSANGYGLAKIKEEFKGEFIDYDDLRLTEVSNGYVMQALFHMLMGETFCENTGCRLFNAHWQSQMIEAQLSGSDFCKHHESMLQNMNNIL